MSREKTSLTKEEKAILAREEALKGAKRLLVAKKAREDFLTFARFMMPDPEDPDDVDRSRFDTGPHHRVIAEALEKVERGEIQRLIISLPPRHGKLCADSTPVLTTEGWKTHGELKVGDYVFHPSGEPIKVIAVGEKDYASVEVECGNGDKIKVHPDHEWTVFQRASRTWRTMETKEFLKSKKTKNPISLSSGAIGKRGGRWLYQLPDIEAPQMPEKHLPMHPYVLGAWLGDGTSDKALITHAPSDRAVIEKIESLGYEVRRAYIHAKTGVVSTAFTGPKPNNPSRFHVELRDMGILKSKRIPEVFFNGSIAQRLELLAGLIDTDGHVCKHSSRVRISTAMPGLALDIERLVKELGMRPYVVKQNPITSSSGIKGNLPVFQIGFQPTRKIPTALKRKSIHRIAQIQKIPIKSVRECEPEYGNCIQVDSPDGLYLVGKNLTPTHNSEMCTRMFPSWFLGKDPYRQIALIGASENFAQDEFGRKIRNYVTSPQYAQVFPRASTARGGSKSVGNIVFDEGGNIKSIGKGGQLVGRGADLLIVDDPYSGIEEALSDGERKKLWNWFTSDAMSRLMPGGRVIIIHQRWHADDLTGRLMDPDHPDHDPEVASKWTHLVVPAVIENEDLAKVFGVDLEVQEDPEIVAQFGKKPIRALWPDHFGLKFFAELKRQNPRSFQALYQGNPALDEGDYFKREWLKTYRTLPKNLRYYAASDHAVSTAQTADYSCFGVVGVDEDDNIYVLPDLFWEQADAESQVEGMLDIIDRKKPIFWWAENGHISKSIGPFLNKRMREEKKYASIIPVTPSKDKMTRARAIQGRMAMGMVFFPETAWWWEKAKNELLRFPNSKNDDFCDMMGLIGIGLDTMQSARPASQKKERPRTGTLAWVKESSKQQQRERRLRAARLF